MGQFLNSSQASKLFREGRTDLLSEFISKHGRQFSAYLIVDELGDVRFDFPKRDSKEFAAQPKPAAAKTVKAEKPAVSLKENQKPQPKQKEFFNLIKAIGIRSTPKDFFCCPAQELKSWKTREFYRL
jgi:hypothetical protein